MKRDLRNARDNTQEKQGEIQIRSFVKVFSVLHFFGRSRFQVKMRLHIRKQIRRSGDR